MVSLILVLFALERYGSPVLAGVVTFLAIAPGLLVSPIAGALLDRHGRIRLIVLDYLTAAAMLALIAVLASFDRLPAPALIVIVTIASFTTPLSLAGQRSLYPLLVPRPLWERANAMDSNVYVVSSIAGPALAGALVAGLRGEGALLVTATLYASAAVASRPLPDPRGETDVGDSLLRDAWAGVVYVARHATLRALAASVSTSNLASGMFFLAVPVMLLHELGADAALVGQVFAATGIAAFFSVFVFGRLGTQGRERWMLAGAMVGTAAAMAVVFAGHSVPTTILGMMLLGLATGPFDVTLFTVRQRRTDPAWIGRAFAVSMSVNFIGFPIGSAIGGPIAAASPRLAIGIAVAVVLVAAVITVVTLPRDAEAG